MSSATTRRDPGIADVYHQPDSTASTVVVVSWSAAHRGNTATAAISRSSVDEAGAVAAGERRTPATGVDDERHLRDPVPVA